MVIYVDELRMFNYVAVEKYVVDSLVIADNKLTTNWQQIFQSRRHIEFFFSCIDLACFCYSGSCSGRSAQLSSLLCL